MEPYYYNRMNKTQQAVYHAIYQGLLRIDDSFLIPRVEAEELYHIFPAAPGSSGDFLGTGISV